MSAERVSYVDSSAIVKLVVRERESAELRRFLRRRPPLVASALARTEVTRAVRSLGVAAVRRADEVLARFELVRITDGILAAAGALEPSELRTLDAIHLATASHFGATLEHVVTYDSRMAEAARTMGLTVAAPS
jgi:predicted nucleic acid-binding protein